MIDYNNLSINLTKTKNIGNISISALGDWAPISGKTSDILLKEGKNYYSSLNKYLDHSNIKLFNLETTISMNQYKSTKFGRKFIDTPEILKSLSYMNINLACLANNHILDNNKEGLIDTQKYLKEFKISHIGAGISQEEIYKPFLYEKENSKIAIINVADGELSNEKYYENYGCANIESLKFFQTIKKYKNLDYIVILVIHAGVEFYPLPTPFIKKMYHDLLDIGADLIIGHHPHVIQSIEIYKNKAIFYSIGHFSIYRENSRPEEKIGLLLDIRINDNTISNIKLIPFSIEKEKLSLLNNEQKNIFISKLKNLNNIVLNDDELKKYWNAYVHNRNFILYFYKITKMFKKNALISKEMIATTFCSINTLQICYEQLNPKNYSNKHIELLKEYRLIKKINLKEILYLKQKNLFLYIERFKIFLFKHYKKFRRKKN